MAAASNTELLNKLRDQLAFIKNTKNPFEWERQRLALELISHLAKGRGWQAEAAQLALEALSHGR